MVTVERNSGNFVDLTLLGPDGSVVAGGGVYHRRDREERREAASPSDDKLREIAAHRQVRMFEIKLAQGAKPGKGGILPGEKVTAEIASIRGIPPGKASISPR